MTAPWDSQFGMWLWDLNLDKGPDWRKITLDDLKLLFTAGENYTRKWAYNGDGKVEYMGMTEPGTSSASIGWKIIKFTYSGNLMTDAQFANGNEAELMLGGAIMYQIPISMVFLSKVLPYKANRRANIIAAGLMTLAVVAGGSTDPHYLVCAGAEIVGFSLIAWNAWKWQNPEDMQKAKKHDFGFNLNHDKKAYGLTYTYKF